MTVTAPSGGINTRLVQQFARNAYRILGLPGNTSPQDIHDAAGDIRRKAKLGIPRNTPWDLPWLGPLSRSELDVQDAVGRLQDPVRRLRERLFWLQEGADVVRHLSPESLQQAAWGWQSALAVLARLRPLSRPAAGHDAAVLSLLAASLLDPEVANEKAWAAAIQQWGQLVFSDEYWEAVADTELENGFEPAASVEEIEALRGRTLNLVLENLAGLAKDSMAHQMDIICRRVLRVLHASRLSGDLLTPLEEQILGPLESNFEALCSEVRSECGNKIIRDDGHEAENIVPCEAALARFEKEVQPFLDRFERFASTGDSGILERIREAAAMCLSGLAQDHTWAGKFSTADELLRKALSFVRPDSAVAQRLQEHLPEIAKGARSERLFRNLKPVKKAPGLQTFNGVGANIYGKTDFDQETGSYLTTYYFVFLFIPLFPISRYRVIDLGNDTYRFIGKAPLRKFDKWHLGVAIFALVCMFAIATADYNHAPSTPPSRTVTSQRPRKPNPAFEVNKRRLLEMEDELQTFDDRRSAIAAQLEAHKRSVIRYESQIRMGVDVNERAYRNTINQHNSLVEEHNRLLAERKRRYQEYKDLLQETNRLNQYNWGR